VTYKPILPIVKGEYYSQKNFSFKFAFCRLLTSDHKLKRSSI